MIRRVMGGMLHKTSLHPSSLPFVQQQASKQLTIHPLDFIPQDEVKSLAVEALPDHNKHQLNLEKEEVKDRMTLHEHNFKVGAEEAYKIILANVVEGFDFTSSTYCTPAMSHALNEINRRIHQVGVRRAPRFIEQTPLITMTILGQWFEMAETRSNHMILGMWDMDHIKREIAAGMVGPEASIVSRNEDDMTYIPIKQTVRVMYDVHYERDDKYDDLLRRVDVFDWERSLSCEIEKEEWTIGNINSLIQK